MYTTSSFNGLQSGFAPPNSSDVNGSYSVPNATNIEATNDELFSFLPNINENNIDFGVESEELNKKSRDSDTQAFFSNDNVKDNFKRIKSTHDATGLSLTKLRTKLLDREEVKKLTQDIAKIKNEEAQIITNINNEINKLDSSDECAARLQEIKSKLKQRTQEKSDLIALRIEQNLLANTGYLTLYTQYHASGNMIKKIENSVASGDTKSINYLTDWKSTNKMMSSEMETIGTNTKNNIAEKDRRIVGKIWDLDIDINVKKNKLPQLDKYTNIRKQLELDKKEQDNFRNLSNAIKGIPILGDILTPFLFIASLFFAAAVKFSEMKERTQKGFDAFRQLCGLKNNKEVFSTKTNTALQPNFNSITKQGQPNGNSITNPRQPNNNLTTNPRQQNVNLTTNPGQPNTVGKNLIGSANNEIGGGRQAWENVANAQQPKKESTPNSPDYNLDNNKLVKLSPTNDGVDPESGPVERQPSLHRTSNVQGKSQPPTQRQNVPNQSNGSLQQPSSHRQKVFTPTDWSLPQPPTQQPNVPTQSNEPQQPKELKPKDNPNKAVKNVFKSQTMRVNSGEGGVRTVQYTPPSAFEKPSGPSTGKN
jgi:hypothetical protein